MRFCLISLMVCLTGLALTAPAGGQSHRPMAADEFIQSSTQLKTGELLVGRTLPGNNSQQLVTIAARPVVAGTRSNADNNLSNRVSAQRPNQLGTYPYPAPTSYPAFRQTSFQSTVASGGQVRTAQNCNCTPGASGGFQVPANTVPSIQAAPLPPPQGRLFVPGTAVNGQAVSPPAFQVPPANYAPVQTGIGSGSWYQPFVAGTGAYQPVFNVRPMPVGTYLGQGIVGQPTAYVAGQTFRNLLRYIFP